VIRRLVGVYHANGTLWGELAYVIRSRLGGAHCSLCDITHGRVREKDEWKQRRTELSVPFDTVHLNERSAELVALTEGNTPCVVAITDDGAEILLGPDELEACKGSPQRLVDAVRAAIEARGLSL
jgi:hypothetical protein